MDYTQNLHLPQWEESDRILRTDFNDAMEKIDAAVTADKLYFGSYVGDGQENRTIQLPFEPRLLIVFGHHYSNGVKANTLIGTQNSTYCISSEGAYISTKDFSGLLSENQLQLGQYPQYNNYSGQTVHYIALK